MSHFSENYDKIILPIADEKKHKIGLRNAQVGAIHAIASFFTLKRDSGAIVVLPTGTGKTAVLQIAPYFLHSSKVLVITPSAMVRNQIYDDYKKLKTLKRINVFQSTFTGPNLYELTKEISSEAEIDETLKDSDVIVATEKCALSLSTTSWAKKNIDLVEVDEGHHDAAQTWISIRSNLESAKYILYTATPFRLDQKEIEGEFIYTYSMSQAFADGVFGKIDFIPIDDLGDKDIALAKKANEVFEEDKKNNLDHFVMVRTNSKISAKKLEDIYRKNTSLKLRVVDSSMLVKDVNDCIEDLKAGKLSGVICVDMLGEGFDFPNLKIAVVHEPQKSLASLLQFIGRFTRISKASKIGDAKLIAPRDDVLKIENQSFFSSDEGWQQLVMNVYDAAIKKSANSQKLVSELKKDHTYVGKINISPRTIRLNKHVKIFKAAAFNVKNNFPKKCQINQDVYRHELRNIVLGISAVNETPLWLNGDYKINLNYELYLVYFMLLNKKNNSGLLFIYSSRQSNALYASIANAFCSKDVYPLPQNEIHRILGDLEDFRIFNSGMLNRYGKNGESYRIMSGANVANSISLDTGRMFSAGHVFCHAKEKGTTGTGETIGYSSGGKVWSAQRVKLAEFVDWCDNLGKKINNAKISIETKTNFDRLPKAEKISGYKQNIYFLDFSHKTYASPVTLYDDQNNKIGLIVDGELELEKNANVADVTKSQKFFYKINSFSEEITVNEFGVYKVSSKKIFVKIAGEKISLEDYFNENPIIFYHADGSTTVGDCCYKTVPVGTRFAEKNIQTIDWNAYGTSLNIEDSKSARCAKNGIVSVQDALEKELLKDPKYKYVFFDHGSGEIADFITLHDDKNEKVISLFHVKATKAKTCNKSVNDAYEVVGQAVKSTRWVESTDNLKAKAAQRNKKSHFIGKKGQYGDFIKELEESQNVFTYQICIVQPSLSPNYKMHHDVADVLSAGEEFIKRMGNMSLIVYGREKES